MKDDAMHNEDTKYDDLARTLRQVTPAPLPGELQRQLERAACLHVAPLIPKTPLADRILALWTCSGALAACAVVALTLWQLSDVPRPAPAAPQDLVLHQQAAQEFEKLIASR